MYINSVLENAPFCHAIYVLRAEYIMLESSLSLYIQEKTVTNANTIASQLHDFATNYYKSKYPEGKILPVIGAVFLADFGLTYPITEASEKFVNKISSALEGGLNADEIALQIEELCKKEIDLMYKKVCQY